MTTITRGDQMKGKQGIFRVINATKYSLAGMRAAWEGEEAFRLEVIAAAILIPVALLLPVLVIERLLLIGTVVLVLVVEVLNSALEATVDRDSLEINPLGKRAKDLGSAAVMLCILFGIACWVTIVANRFL